MAVRFDTAGDFLTRVTDLPSITLWTMMGWFKVSVSSGAYQAFASFGKTDASTFYYMGLDSTGATQMVYNGSSQFTTGAQAITTGIWYHAALVCNGSSTNNLKYYLNGKNIVTGDGNASVTAVEMYLGYDDSGSDQMNGCAEDFFVYNAALTQVQIQRQMQQRKPLSRAALNAWYPLDATLKDYSGRGNDWTEHGTISYEPGPGTPNTRARARRTLQAVSAGGGGGGTAKAFRSLLGVGV